ncbi:MAG TPA: ATP synthase F1 subunit delta [Bacillota bacterium]
MRNRTIARRYAQGLFLLAQEHDVLERLGGELAAVVETLKQAPGLRALLEHPQVPAPRKLEQIEATFGERLSPLVLNFLRLLVRKRRESYLDLIVDEFRRAYDEARGIRYARVISAVELPAELVERVREALSRALGLDVRVDTDVDPDIIGGLVVQIGDRRVDASLRGQLRALRERLAAGRTQMGVS